MSGSKKRPKAPSKDVTTMTKTRHREAPPEASGEVHNAIQGLAVRAQILGEVPASAMENPIAFAEKHLENLAPQSAKEMEWALKFGSDDRRYNAAKDILAIKGLTTKPKESGVPAQAMTIVFNGPVTKSGAPILPYMNAALPPGPEVAPSDAVVTVTPTPATKKDTR